MELQTLYERTGTDYKVVMERFCNDENMLRMFVLSFPDDPTFQNLTLAVQSADSGSVENHAHALKGVAANLGFEKLQDACADLVLCVRQNRLDEIQLRFQKAETAYKAIVEEIHRIKE